MWGRHSCRRTRFSASNLSGLKGRSPPRVATPQLSACRPGGPRHVYSQLLRSRAEPRRQESQEALTGDRFRARSSMHSAKTIVHGGGAAGDSASCGAGAAWNGSRGTDDAAAPPAYPARDPGRPFRRGDFGIGLVVRILLHLASLRGQRRRHRNQSTSRSRWRFLLTHKDRFALPMIRELQCVPNSAHLR